MDEEIFFNDIFKKLLNDYSEFTIDYDHKMTRYKGEEYISYSVKGINGKRSIWQFKSDIKNSIKEGLNKLTEVLEGSSIEDKINLLEYFSEEFENLKSKAVQKEIEYPEFEGEPGGVYTFYGFVNPKFQGTKGNDPYHKDTIEKKAQTYAKAWIESVNDAKSKIDFLINQVELLPQSKEIIKDPNTINIFFSWQSDNNDERKFIRKALSEIVKTFKQDGYKIIIDSDMRDVPGSEDIPNTLFTKIENCDIFIADLNVVFSSLFREGVYSPNPNVLIELGYAASKLGWGKIIMLFNTDKHGIENLPFDIRQRSILWYNSKTMDDLKNKLVYAIRKISNK